MKLLRLDRNRIYKIGKFKTTLLKVINKRTNKCLRKYDIYRTYRRKNKVIAYSENCRKLTLTFKNIKHAEKCKQQIKNAIT